MERDEAVAQAHVRLRSELSPARGTLGDPILWKLTATVPPGIHPAGVRVAPTPATLEIDTTRAGARSVAGQVQDRSRSLALLLRGFGLGAIPLPRATLLVTAGGRADTLEFPADTLFVDSLTAQSTGQLRPDRGPIQTPLRAIDVAVMIAGGVILLAILIAAARALLRKRRRKEVATPVAAPEPPESILGRELDALERELPSLPRDLFYERLAQSLRRYASAVTGIDALDLTTSELDRALAKRSSGTTRERLIATLKRADLAKFGRFEDQESEARSILRDARTVGGAL